MHGALFVLLLVTLSEMESSPPATTAKIPFVVPKPEPMPTVKMVDKSTEPMAKHDLPTPKKISHGGLVLPGVPSPDRIVVETDGNKGVYVDVRSGSVLAKLPAAPGHVSPSAGAVSLEGTPRLLRLSDAQIVTPRIESEGRPLEETWFVVAPMRRGVLALAHTHDKVNFVGVVSQDLSTVRMVATPLDRSTAGATTNAFGGFPVKVQNSFGMDSSTPYTWPHQDRCVSFFVDDNGQTMCREFTPQSSYSPDTLRWMDNGWFSGSSWVSNLAWGENRIAVSQLLGGDSCFARGTRDSPPRVVFTCANGPVGAVWSPGKLLTFPSPKDHNDVGGLIGADSGEVMPIPDVSLDAEHTRVDTSHFINMAEGRLITTPKVVPLGIASFAGVGRKSMVEQHQDKLTDVWLMDFDSATRELVEHVTDCPGEMGELVDEDGKPHRWLTLACLTHPPPHMVSQRLIWAEIIDTETHLRYRTTLMPEVIFDDGVVVLSARRSLSAETKATPGDIFAVDLLAK
jgi:hypothetical protein